MMFEVNNLGGSRNIVLDRVLIPRNKTITFAFCYVVVTNAFSVQVSEFTECCRMLSIIDGLAREMQDPQISVHISSVSSAVESVVRISIAFVGYENPKFVLFCIKSN